MHSLTFTVADTPQLLDKIFQLRYEVYVEELGFISKNTCLGGKEVDKFDACSMHFAALDKEGNLAGAARLVRNSPIGFPLEKFCNYQLPLEVSEFAPFRKNIAEVSRLVISKKYRTGLPNKSRHAYNTSHLSNESKSFKPKISPIVHGLYALAHQLCKPQDIIYWIAAMDYGLFQLLNNNGFCFHSMGEPIDYYGRVLPCITLLEEIEDNLRNFSIDSSGKIYNLSQTESACVVL